MKHKAHRGNGDSGHVLKSRIGFRRFCDKTSSVSDMIDSGKRYASLPKTLTFEQKKRSGILPNLTSTNLGVTVTKTTKKRQILRHIQLSIYLAMREGIPSILKTAL